MRIFADTADREQMSSLADRVDGFTTNPTLMRAAGVTDYATFVDDCVHEFPGHDLSFEVIADDLPTMATQARTLAAFGPNVYVKIPVTLTDGTSTVGLIHELAHDGIHVNVTAVFTPKQAWPVIDALRKTKGTRSIVSVFAGRIADTGVDPTRLLRPMLSYATEEKGIDFLWASAREVFNVHQAAWVGCDIITLEPGLIRKLGLADKDLEEYSRETVQMFRRDALAAGLTL